MSKSQIITSAWNPMCVFCPEAKNLPDLDKAITEISLSWPLRNDCTLEIICLIIIVDPKGYIKF